MTTQRRCSSRPAGKVLPPEVTVRQHPRSTEAGGRVAEWASAAAAQGRTSVLGPRHVLHLQRHHGNRAVTGLITAPSAVVQRSALEKSATEAERNKAQRAPGETRQVRDEKAGGPVSEVRFPVRHGFRQ
jgi:hypothetical protein